MRDWIYIVAEPRRSELLRAWGVSEAAIRLGTYDQKPHPVFEILCGEPWRSSDDQYAPTGKFVVGVYESSGDGCRAFRMTEHGLEYLEFDAESLDDASWVGRGENALWIALFADLVAETEWPDAPQLPELREAAAVVGFTRLPDVVTWVAAGTDERIASLVARLCG